MLLATGIIYNVQRYSIHDGPGIRTTVFLKGCPLDCWWCHNPESQKPGQEIIFWEERCLRCGDCAGTCKKGAVVFRNNMPVILTENCDLCGSCSSKCPSGAQEMVGRKVSAAELMKEIEKDTIFFDESGGGVTFSGGEPLMQPDFLDELLKRCKEKQINTAVDTSGYASWETVNRISENADLFLYDIKLMDNIRHKKYTGVDNDIIINNLKLLARKHNNIVIRVPVVPGINDSSDDMLAIGEFVLTLGIKSLNILPYHNTGMDKYRRLHLEYKIPETKPPSQERMGEIKDRLESLGLNIKIGG